MKEIARGLALALPVPLEAATNAALESYRTAAQREAPGLKKVQAALGQTLYDLKTGDDGVGNRALGR